MTTQSYLLSIRPFLTPKPSATAREGDVEEEQKTRSKIVSAEDDAVYHWGRDVEVDWKMVTYVTLRDQVRQTWVWMWWALCRGCNLVASSRSVMWKGGPLGRAGGGGGRTLREKTV